MTRRNIDKPSAFKDKKFSIDSVGGTLSNTGDSKLRSINDIVLGIQEDALALLSSSFILNQDEGGLVSTQQLKADYSDFVNHTFFNSAIVNTNVAFDKVINNYPFDGTRVDIVQFLEKLSGFERWVFDNFPQNIGYLNLSGGLSASISTQDYANTKRIGLENLGSGYNVVDPGDDKSFTIEAQLLIPEIDTQRYQVIFQKLEGTNNGISLMLSESRGDTASGSLIFAVTSGSYELFASASVEKGKFNHIAAVFDREDDVHRVKIYNNSKLIVTSSEQNIGKIFFSTASINIGSGTLHSFNSKDYTPLETFSGSIDELRVWHATRSIEELKRFSVRNVFSEDALRLYYRFNESAQTDKPNLVIDHSGFGLHGKINLASGLRFESMIDNALHVSASMRLTTSVNNPVTNENRIYLPVLYSSHKDVKAFNADLISSASNYDTQNPNLITRLVPQHYFEEGSVFESQRDDVDLIQNTIDTFDNKLGTAQLFSSFLYVIAKALDELKIFVDQFQNILTVNLDEFDTAPDALIDKVADFYGLEFSTFFDDATFRQIFFSENVTVDDDLLSITLLELRDQLWKRIFSALPDIMKSKGTIHAIKSFIRSVGINPDRNFRIREYGGPTIGTISDIRIPRGEVSTMLELSSSGGNSRGSVRSPFLTASMMHVENYITPHALATSSFNNRDILRQSKFGGMLTSQSFTIEQIFKLPKNTTATQSLSRVVVTGSNATLTDLVINVVALSSSASPFSSSVKLFAKPITASEPDQSDRLIITLSGASVFDGDKWNLAYGRRIISDVSSSWFLYAAKNKNGEIDTIYTASAAMRNTGANGHTVNVLNTLDEDFNASGAFVMWGSASLGQSGGSTMRLLLSGTSLGGEFAPVDNVDFNGKIAQMRFWTKGLSVNEFREHTKNFKSIGINTPRNTSHNTGSDERLIFDVSTDQPLKKTDSAGGLTLFDFTQNGFHLSGTNFIASDTVIKNEDFEYSILSPFFDENQTLDKVTIRSFKEKNNIAEFNVPAAPVTEVAVGERVSTDPRFSIDFSIVEALDEDIIKIMSTLDSFNNDIGNVQNMFAFEYKNLRDLRRLYFKRLTDAINFKSFFDFFIWFDQNIGDFIRKLIPAKANFRGINYVVESHILERPKYNYNYFDIYLDEDVRNHAKVQEVILDREGAVE